MKKELSIGKVLIAGMLFACAIILAYLGVMAYKKGMYINMHLRATPDVLCEIQMLRNGESSFKPIFCNVLGSESVASGISLNEKTSTLSFNSSFSGGVGAGFFLRVFNHTEQDIIVETSGTGVAQTFVAINEYNGSTAPHEDLTISVVGTDFTLTFTKAYRVTPSFTAVEFNLNAENNTLYKYNNIYYQKVNQNLTAVLAPTNTNACPDIYSLTINNGASQMASINSGALGTTTNIWYNTLTQTLFIPASSLSGDVALTSSIYWDGSSATRFAEGRTTATNTGTEANPFKIATGKQLMYLRNNHDSRTTGNYYLIVNDIYLNNFSLSYNVVGTEKTTTVSRDGETIAIIDSNANNSSFLNITGTDSDLSSLHQINQITFASTATFDGGNKTIYGEYSTGTRAGLIGNVSRDAQNNNGIIKNIKIDRSLAIGISPNSCVYSSFLGSYSHATYCNCSVSNSIVMGRSDDTLSDISRVGGVVANVRGIMQNCFGVNNIVISKTPSNIGGGTGNFVGLAFNSPDYPLIENCYNYGGIVETNTSAEVCEPFLFRTRGTVVNCYIENPKIIQTGTGISNCGTYDGSTGILTNSATPPVATPVTINGTSCSTLVEALNAWINAQTTPSLYKTWQTNPNINNGLPYFA